MFTIGYRLLAIGYNMVDACSRRMPAFTLIYDPPSYRSCMLVLRDCVHRHQRLPQSVVVDGGVEFGSIYFETLLARYGVTRKTRPGGQPRFGSVEVHMQSETADVLVLGAGVAGLAAAAELSQAGRDIIVLEARDRMGGRISTQRMPGYPLPLELGAEFIHGRPPESFALVERAGLCAEEIRGEGWLARENRLVPTGALWEKTERIFVQMATERGPDRSFQSFLARFQNDLEWRDAAARAASYIEGFEAADTADVSVQALVHEQHADAAIEGDRMFRIAGGYDQLIAALAATWDPSRVTLKLGTVATRVAWQHGRVEIQAHDGATGTHRSFQARQALITLPLGVLRAPPDTPGAVQFDPVLAQHTAAAHQLAMGQVVKLIVRFSTRFWQHDHLPLASASMDPQRLSFIFTRDGALPTWWTAHPHSAPQLTGWAGGPRAVHLVHQPEHVLVDQGLDTLANALHVPRRDVEDMFVSASMHNWSTDPFARGAYSYVRVGGMDAVRALATPVQNTLFFAGEATNGDGHIGTVHGALATGRRAAHDILQPGAR